MEKYASYANDLERLALSLIRNPNSFGIYKKSVLSALNGGPGKALRKIIPATQLKRTGTFFTGEKLASLVTDKLGPGVNSGTFFDPACGAGDLLISVARQLPLRGSLSDTLISWGQQLYGYDVHKEFVRATKLRLVLTALERGDSQFTCMQVGPSDDYFPHVRIANGLKSVESYSVSSHIVINPPFYPMQVSKDCRWAGGKVSAAALFLDACVTKARPGTKIVAILPDVLRSGTFYQHWRENISARALINDIYLFGQFDQWTDVDVFVISLTVLESPDEKSIVRAWWKTEYKTKKIGDFFDVSVGPVVPFRDPEEGREYDYLQPKNLPKWQTVRNIFERRRYLGKVLKPPFVVVRRNSRFDDEYRATATIIATRNRVAVENHLVVLRPKDGKIKTCQKLIEVLHSVETNAWLNQRIRCRHLTIPAIREIPWQD